MNDTSFKIRIILFDLLVAVGALALAAPFALITAFIFKSNLEEILGFSISLFVLFWTIFFYLMRRQFKWRLTIIQIVITTAVTWGFPYLLFLLVCNLSGAGTDMIWPIIPFCAIITLIFTKHSTDRFIARKYFTN